MRRRRKYYLFLVCVYCFTCYLIVHCESSLHRLSVFVFVQWRSSLLLFFEFHSVFCVVAVVVVCRLCKLISFIVKDVSDKVLSLRIT